MRTYLKKSPIQKRTDEVAQGVDLSSNPSTAKKKRRKRIILSSCLPPATLKIQPQYVFSFPGPYPAPVLSGRPCRDAHQDPVPSNSILSKPMKSVQTYLSSQPKEIKTLPGVFTLHYRTCRDPAHPLPTHLPTHCLIPFPPMAVKLSVHNAQILSLMLPGFFIFRVQLTWFLLLYPHCLATLL
jgi:hypothetical protein